MSYVLSRLPACALLALLTLGALLALAPVAPAQAQTVVACPGANSSNSASRVSFTLPNGPCVIEDGSASGAPSNTLNFGVRVTGGIDIYQFRERGAGGGATDVAFASCLIAGVAGTVVGSRCERQVNLTNVNPPGPVYSHSGVQTTGGVTYTFDVTTTSIAADSNVGITTATVTFTTPATGPSASDKSNTVAALQSSFDAATPGLLDNLPVNGDNEQGGNGVTFAPTGLAFSLGRGDTNNPLDRDYGTAFADTGYFAGGQTRQRGNGFNFSVDMRALARSANSRAAHSASPPDLFRGSNSEPAATALMDTRNKSGYDDLRTSGHDDVGDGAETLGYGASGSKDAPYQSRSRFNTWVKGEYVDFDDDEANADRDGHLWVVTSGIAMQVGAQTTIGVLSRYRDGEADSNALNAELDSEFYGGGAFLTTTLGGGLKVALAGLYETGDNDIRIGTATGSFDSEHVTLEGRIDKRFERGTFWIEPGVGIRYIDTDQDNYTDSAGTLVTNQDLTLGRLTYGPTVGTTIVRGNATLKPFAKINGVWDFENDGTFATSTAGTFTSGDNAINLGGGIEIAYASGMVLKVEGNWYTFDSDLEAWSISGGIGAPLSAFGIGSVGLASLDLAANAEDTSATARIRIPLGN